MLLIIIGYTGSDCKQKTCGVDCNDLEGWGYCNGHDGQCYCESGYGGVDCSIKLIGCPNDCNGNGICTGEPKSCKCNDDYSGIACEVKACPVGTIQPHQLLLPIQKSSATGGEADINGATGGENEGSSEGATGAAAPSFMSFLETEEQRKSLPQVCSQHGVCAPGIGGLCECGPGYYGGDCSCTHDCYNGGTCYGGVCLCAYGWRGLNCSHTICPNDCSKRGECVDETCKCDEGFGGDDCSERRCPNNCKNNGLCDKGVCACNFGFGGQDCALQFSGNNKINDMICAASEGYLNAFYNFRKIQLQMEDDSLRVDDSSILRLTDDLKFSTHVLEQRSSDLQVATEEKSKEYSLSVMNSVNIIEAEDKSDREQMKIAMNRNNADEYKESSSSSSSSRKVGEPPINMTAVRVGKAARRKWRSELNGIIGMCVKDIPCPHNCTGHIDPLTKLSSGGYCVEGKYL